MKALDTVYRGYRFRSRLEARWAVYLDKIGWEWDYEPEAFDLGDGLYYLPDFYLKNACQCWLEVKPFPPPDIERVKMRRLVRFTGRPLLLAVGPPDANILAFYGLPMFSWHAAEQKVDYQEAGASICHVCFTQGARIGRDKVRYPDGKTIAACIAARQARFDQDQSLARSEWELRRGR